MRLTLLLSFALIVSTFGHAQAQQPTPAPLTENAAPDGLGRMILPRTVGEITHLLTQLPAELAGLPREASQPDPEPQPTALYVLYGTETYCARNFAAIFVQDVTDPDLIRNSPLVPS